MAPVMHAAAEKLSDVLVRRDEVSAGVREVLAQLGAGCPHGRKKSVALVYRCADCPMEIIESTGKRRDFCSVHGLGIDVCQLRGSMHERDELNLMVQELLADLAGGCSHDQRILVAHVWECLDCPEEIIEASTIRHRTMSPIMR